MARRDSKVIKVNKASKESAGKEVAKVFWASKAIKANKASKANRVLWDLRAIKEEGGYRGYRVKRATRETGVKTEDLEKEAGPEHWE